SRPASSHPANARQGVVPYSAHRAITGQVGPGSGSILGPVETPRQRQERDRRERQRPRGAVPNPHAPVATFREQRGLAPTQPSNPRLDIRVGADPSLPTEGPEAPVRNKDVT
ncbi:hypothetical protein KIPB_014706, partial [Kipferlia bialata]